MASKNNKKSANKKIDDIEENLKIAEVKEVPEEHKNEEKIKEEKPSNDNKEEKNQKQVKDKTNRKIEKADLEKEQKALIEKKENIKKKKMYIAINLFLILIVISLFSTVFAIININNPKIVKGVKIKNIDISNLSIEEAKNKITEAINIELIPEIKLNYNEYETTLKPKNFEYTYKIDLAIEEARNVGRKGNILENNYELLLSAFFGKEVNIVEEYNEELLNAAVDSIASSIPGVVVNPSYYIENDELIINRGTPGIKVEKEKLKENILSLIKNRNASDILLKNKISEELEIPVQRVNSEDIDMDKIYSEIYKKPQDAYFIKEPFEIVTESDGIDLQDSLENIKSVINNEKKDEYKFALKITKPQKTVKDLGAEAFPYTISKFSTRYDASNIDRSNNLKISADKINGTVLMPGETFSFNKVVGKRTIEDGYRNAKIYANGGVVDGLAGGICQISSTLYNAALIANLKIEERRNHRFKTSYVAAGRDATVVYGTIDFKFINSRSYPIKIGASVENGVAEFTINGIQEEIEYEIKILPSVTQTIPYPTEEVIDPTLAPGTRVTIQKGSSGCKVTTYKETRLNGAVVSKEILSNDTYSPLKSIVKVGP